MASFFLAANYSVCCLALVVLRRREPNRRGRFARGAIRGRRHRARRRGGVPDRRRVGDTINAAGAIGLLTLGFACPRWSSLARVRLTTPSNWAVYFTASSPRITLSVLWLVLNVALCAPAVTPILVLNHLTSLPDEARAKFSGGDVERVRVIPRRVSRAHTAGRIDPKAGGENQVARARRRQSADRRDAARRTRRAVLRSPVQSANGARTGVLRTFERPKNDRTGDRQRDSRRRVESRRNEKALATIGRERRRALFCRANSDPWSVLRIAHRCSCR